MLCDLISAVQFRSTSHQRDTVITDLYATNSCAEDPVMTCHLTLLVYNNMLICCDQMKLIVFEANTIPVVTPVATATTLPPSIMALQQQGLQFFCFLVKDYNII